MSEVIVPAPEQEEGVRLTAEQLRRRRTRSIAIAIALAAFMAIFYVVTIAKIGANVMAMSL
jgi:hypothetical protein